MARGRLAKTKAREAKAIAKAIFKGQQDAEKQKSEVVSLREHIERAIDRLEPVDAALYGGLAIAGYEKFKDWKGALVGPIALKLATAPNEIASLAGLLTLTSLGLAFVLTDDQQQLITTYLGGVFNGELAASATVGLFSPVEEYTQDMITWVKCKDGYALFQKPNGEYACVNDTWAWAASMQGYRSVKEPSPKVQGGQGGVG